ncbi:MAG: hypothetical protein F4003_08105 [Acidimicrobiaceae bacterium]|nr:hypothetical protein [Acidimicrobiaceae bacterium]MXW61729.1 hypothetical protein [Acidimicrobiaceae bacterium]
MRRWLVLVAAAGLLAAVMMPAQVAGAEAPADLVAEIEERIASLEAKGKQNAKQRWERALAAIRCEPGAMSLEEIERRAKRRFNTELWVGVLAAAQACAADPAPEGDSESDDTPVLDTEPQFFSSSRSQQQPSRDQSPANRRPELTHSWPSSLTVFGAVTYRLSLSDEFNDPDGDSLSYTVEVYRIHGGATVAGASARIESGELVITTVAGPSATTFKVTAKDGSSNCPSSSGGTMECRATSYINVRVLQLPTRSESDWVNISVAPYGIGLEGISYQHQGGSAQGCVPFAFDLSKPAPRRFVYEYRIVPVPESTTLTYPLVGSSSGAPASFFDDNTTNVWRQAGFQHQITEDRSSTNVTTGGFCVQLKGVSAVSNAGHNTYTDHCPKGQFRHFFVEMRIPDYWSNLVGVRMVEGKTRSIMNITCQ